MTDKDDDDFEEYEEDEIGPFGTNGDDLERLATYILKRLNAEEKKDIDLTDYFDLQELIMELEGLSNSISSELGVNSSIINKVRKGNGQLPTHQARKLVDRARSYVRAQGYVSSGITIPEIPPPPVEPRYEFRTSAIEWRLLKRTDELSAKIETVIILIQDVVRHTTTCNLPTCDRALTEIERAQLIAILETALNMLKSPMIETGLLKKAKRMLKHAGEKAVEKQVELALGAAASALGTGIGYILTHL